MYQKIVVIESAPAIGIVHSKVSSLQLDWCCPGNDSLLRIEENRLEHLCISFVE